MFETLKRLFNSGKATEKTINNAVVKGYITHNQADEIMGV